MNAIKVIITITLYGLLLIAMPLSLAQSVTATSQTLAKRGTLAISYPENEGTSIDMVGTALKPRVSGKADVKRSEGRTRVKLDITNLDSPLSLTTYYTTYVLWAISPE